MHLAEIKHLKFCLKCATSPHLFVTMFSSVLVRNWATLGDFFRECCWMSGQARSFKIRETCKTCRTVALKAWSWAPGLEPPQLWEVNSLIPTLSSWDYFYLEKWGLFDWEFLQLCRTFFLRGIWQLLWLVRNLKQTWLIHKSIRPFRSRQEFCTWVSFEIWNVQARTGFVLLPPQGNEQIYSVLVEYVSICASWYLLLSINNICMLSLMRCFPTLVPSPGTCFSRIWSCPCLDTLGEFQYLLEEL